MTTQKHDEAQTMWFYGTQKNIHDELITHIWLNFLFILYWQILQNTCTQWKHILFFPNHFFLLALDDNYSKSVKQKHTNNSYVWKREDDEEWKGIWDDTTRKYCICHHNFYGQRSRPKQLSILEWVQYFIRDMR